MNRCLPLELTKKTVKKHKNYWNYIEEFINDDTLPRWDQRCYIPIGPSISIANGDNEIPIGNEEEGAIIAAVAPWRLNKHIYSFDKIIEETLLDQKDKGMKISIDHLNSLPDYCIYVQTQTIQNLDGFFVHFESDVNNGEFELRFLLLSNDGERTIPIPLHIIGGATIEECIEHTFQRIRKNMPSFLIDNKELEVQQKISLEICSKLIQLVLYICYKNEDKEKTTDKRQDSVKDTYDEVQYTYYGQNSGDIIKKMYDL